MQDSLESLALKLGMLVASSLLEDEVTRQYGRRYERQPHRTHTRYGRQRGTATLAGQKIAIARPRVRGTDGGGEVYRADDLTLGHSVALKFLPAERARDPERLARFHAEVRTARLVSRVMSWNY